MQFRDFLDMHQVLKLFLFAFLIPGAFLSSSAFAQLGPFAVDDFYSVDEDSLLTVDPIGVLQNDTNNPDSAIFVAIIKTSTGFGTLTLNSDGSFTYQPNLNFNSVDTFTYVANNGTHSSNEATVTLTVNPVNDAPAASDDTYTITEDSELIISSPGVLGNDSDVDSDSLLAIIDTSTSNGVLVFTSDGSFSYTPNANFAGSDSFTYHANDGQLDSNIATVNITITSENDAPVAANDLAETKQNTPILIDVLANDSDVENDPLNIVLTTDPIHTKGTVVVEDSKVLFTPNLDFVGETTFPYVLSDGEKTSNSALVTVTVTPVDDPEDSILDQILEKIQSLVDKILNMEDEITLLKKENSALAMRVSHLESIIENDLRHDDDDDDSEKILVCHKGKKTISISENGLSGHLKHGDTVGECSDDDLSIEKNIKNQLKELKEEFKAQEKDLKKQLKELKKDKKIDDDDDDEDDDDEDDDD